MIEQPTSKEKLYREALERIVKTADHWHLGSMYTGERHLDAVRTARAALEAGAADETFDPLASCRAANSHLHAALTQVRAVGRNPLEEWDKEYICGVVEKIADTALKTVDTYVSQCAQEPGSESKT